MTVNNLRLRGETTAIGVGLLGGEAAFMAVKSPAAANENPQSLGYEAEAVGAALVPAVAVLALMAALKRWRGDRR